MHGDRVVSCLGFLFRGTAWRLHLLRGASPYCPPSTPLPLCRGNPLVCQLFPMGHDSAQGNRWRMKWDPNGSHLARVTILLLGRRWLTLTPLCKIITRLCFEDSFWVPVLPLSYLIIRSASIVVAFDLCPALCCPQGTLRPINRWLGILGRNILGVMLCYHVSVRWHMISICPIPDHADLDNFMKMVSVRCHSYSYFHL